MKGHLLANFCPFSWMGPKFTLMSAHPGVSFMWLMYLEKHSLNYYAIWSSCHTLLKVITRWLCINACCYNVAVLTVCTMLILACSECACFQDFSYESWWLHYTYYSSIYLLWNDSRGSSHCKCAWALLWKLPTPLFGTCTYNIHVYKLWECTFHYDFCSWSFHSYNLYIGHEIHVMGVELHQTCVSVGNQISYIFNLQFMQGQLLHNTCSIKQKAQLKLASTVCGVKGQYSNVRQGGGGA